MKMPSTAWTKLPPLQRSKPPYDPRSDTIAKSIHAPHVRTHPQRFRHIDIANSKVASWPAHGPEYRTPTCETRKFELMETLHMNALWYRLYTQDALNQITAVETMSEEELDAVVAMHTQVVERFEAALPRMNNCWAMLSKEWQEAVDYAEPKWQEGWEILKDAYRTLEILNDPKRWQRLRDETAEQMEMIKDYIAQRRSNTLRWHTRVQNALEDFREDPDMTQSARQDQVKALDDQWKYRQSKMRQHHEELKAELKPSLRRDIETTTNEELRSIVIDEDGVDHALDQMWELAFADEEDEEQEGEEPAMIPWTPRQLQDLRNDLPQPVAVIVNIPDLRLKAELTHEETQLLDNKCGVCWEKCKEHARVGCASGHIFCFECIVPWIEHKGECPKCRAKTQLKHLSLLDVRLEGQSEEDQEDEFDRMQREAREEAERQFQRDMNALAESYAKWRK